LLKKLEVRRFREGKKKPRGKKVPAVQSYTKELETTNKEYSKEEASQENSEDDEDDVEEQSENNDLGEDNSNEEFGYVELLPDLDGPCGGEVASRSEMDSGSGVESSSGVASGCRVAGSSGVASCQMVSYEVESKSNLNISIKDNG
jgi:hypothetical protein